ncbi:hypothetical protein NBH08_19630 [Faecalicatena sp. BF-R-105]|nr:hypothetical protein [Faecalicatena sp. BF-R-105]
MPAGLELYRTAVRLIERYRMHSTPVKLAVQADRTPIDDEWAACLFVDASRKAEKECLACRRYPLCRGVCCRGREFGRCAGAELPSDMPFQDSNRWPGWCRWEDSVPDPSKTGIYGALR